ncbi:MAG: hypothetical protein Kow0068_19450 [Marinilabiliales bacterium]
MRIKRNQKENNFKLVKTPVILICIAVFIFLISSCRSNNKVITLEERDPMVKTLHEHDSLVVYPRDTIKKN